MRFQKDFKINIQMFSQAIKNNLIFIGNSLTEEEKPMNKATRTWLLVEESHQLLVSSAGQKVLYKE